MKIGVLGDVHGHVFHALAVLIRWQARTKEQFDLIVQTGDLGVWPFPERADAPTRRFAASDPGEFDFRRLLDAGQNRADDLLRIRQQLRSPVLFVRGNHDDDAWLKELASGGARPVPADPVGLFHYVPDGAVLDHEGITIAFLGGTRPDRENPGAHRNDACEQLLRLSPGGIDLLVTHDAPWGLATSKQGVTRGSRRIANLVEALRPRYHVFGHYHHAMGPTRLAETLCIGLGQLVSPAQDESEQVVQPGCLGVLDTASERTHFVTDSCLPDLCRDLDLDAVLRQIRT